MSTIYAPSSAVRRPFAWLALGVARDRRGATLVEFAFVIIPLTALLIAILQTSLTFFAQQTLQTTAEKSVRQLMTGEAQKAGLNQTQFKANVCKNLPAFLKCANTIVDVTTATTFSAANTASPTLTYDKNGNITNTWGWAPGTSGEITIVKIMYIWDVQKGPLGFDLSNLSNGKRLLITTSVFKTEPYTA